MGEPFGKGIIASALLSEAKFWNFGLQHLPLQKYLGLKEAPKEKKEVQQLDCLRGNDAEHREVQKPAGNTRQCGWRNGQNWSRCCQFPPPPGEVGGRGNRGTSLRP